eukprot:GILI01002017.1.p1 GENE.GILI01002017.1~~GILI01002017.1.p1  ORF type:complete len:239 (+),score=74.02 GILI01002017.1:117-833(+)
MLPIKDSRNVLLIKDEVGKCRPTYYKLPGPEFTYGRAEQKANEGTKEALTNWAVSERNIGIQQNRDFRALNKMSVKDHCVSAKTVSEFRREHDVRLKNSTYVPPRRPLPSQTDDNFRYGKPSKPSTPIAAIVSHEYAREAEERQIEQYLRTEGQKYVVGRIPNPKPTKASEGHRLAHEATVKAQQEELVAKKPFKLQKFENVPSRVQGLRKSASTSSLSPSALSSSFNDTSLSVTAES